MVCRKCVKDGEELGTFNYAETGVEGPTCAPT